MVTLNTSIKYLLIMLLAIIVASCASLSPPEHRMPPSEDYIAASWYGADFHGRTILSPSYSDASGEDLTCKTF